MLRKYRVVHRTYLLIALLLLLSMPIKAAENSLLVYAENDWPPYSNADGTGIANNILQAAYLSVGIDVTFDILPFARILKKLDNGDAIVGINVGYVFDTRKRFLFGNHPIFSVSSHYYHWHNSPLNATHKSELKPETKIGLILGYHYGDFIDLNTNNLALHRVKTHQQNIDKLAIGRLDGLLIYDDVAEELIRTHNLQGLLKKAFPGDSIAIYAAFSKKHPDSEKYMHLLDEGLKRIVEEGTYTKIMDSKN